MPRRGRTTTRSCTPEATPAEEAPVEEAPADVEETATIEIVTDSANAYAVDENSPVKTEVRFGLWDNAFSAAGAVLNGSAENANFVGSDSRRFYFRVQDPNATTASVDINWKTLDRTRADEDAPASMVLTLLETAADSKVFVSKAVMLVTETDDRDQATDSGLPAPYADAGSRSRGQSNHRLRKGSLRGYVKGEYTPGGGGQAVEKELPIFRNGGEQRKAIPIQLFVLRVANGGNPVVPTGAGSAVWGELAQIRDTYARLGMRVDTVVANGTAQADIVTVGSDKLVEIDPPQGVNAGNVSYADETTIGTAHPATAANTMRGFYVGGLGSGNRGEAWRDGIAPVGHARRGTIFFRGVAATYNAAHEMGHILTDAGHYDRPAAPAGNRLYEAQNLMKNGTSVTTGADKSKRLWDKADANGVNQYTSIRGSHYTRAW